MENHFFRKALSDYLWLDQGKHTTGLATAFDCSDQCRTCDSQDNEYQGALSRYHLRVCNVNGNRTIMHTQLVHALGSLLGKFNIPCKIEPRKIGGNFSNIEGPDIIIHYEGRPYYLDLSIRDFFSSNLRTRAAKIALTAARNGESDKKRRYEQRLNQIEASFIPLIIESGGAFGDRWKEFFHIITEYAEDWEERLDYKLGFNCKSIKQYFVQAVSVLFWKAKISCIEKTRNSVLMTN